MTENMLIIKHALNAVVGGPAEDFEQFLKERRTPLLSIQSHPLNLSSEQVSAFSVFAHGELVTLTSRARDRWLVRSRLFDFFFNVKVTTNLVFAFNSWALLLAKISYRGAVHVYWGVDYVPMRSNCSVLSRILRSIENSLINRADLIIDNNDFAQKARLRNRKAINSQKLLIVPICHKRKILDIDSRNGQADSQLRLVYFGTLNERNGAHRIIEIAKQINLQYPNFTLSIIGDGELKSLLESESKTANLTRKIVFLGLLQRNVEFDKIMANACFGLAPYDSIFDSHTKYADPGKLVEYVAHGVIPVVSNVPLVARNYESQDACLVIDESEYSPEIWARKIIEVFKDRERYKALFTGVINVAAKRQSEKVYNDLLSSIFKIVRK